MGDLPRQRCKHGYVIDLEDPCPECEVERLLAELRQARLDALEEAALACEVRWLQKGMGIGKDYAATIRALKESEPECG